MLKMLKPQRKTPWSEMFDKKKTNINRIKPGFNPPYLPAASPGARLKIAFFLEKLLTNKTRSRLSTKVMRIG